MKRRQLLLGAGAVTLLPPALRIGRAQADGPPPAAEEGRQAGMAPTGTAPAPTGDPISDFLTRGAPVHQERVHLELPVLIENGNSVPLKVSVDSPMTPQDHVRVIHLLSEKNPVRHMAAFHLGPRAGRAEIQTRVRLAGSQRVVALAQMSDGSFYSGSRRTVVTLSACVDDSTS